MDKKQHAKARNMYKMLIAKVLGTETWNTLDEKIKIISNILRSDDMGSTKLVQHLVQKRDPLDILRSVRFQTNV